MADPEIRKLLDKAKQLKKMSERLIEQSRKVKEQSDALIAQSKKLTATKPKLP